MSKRPFPPGICSADYSCLIVNSYTAPHWVSSHHFCNSMKQCLFFPFFSASSFYFYYLFILILCPKYPFLPGLWPQTKLPLAVAKETQGKLGSGPMSLVTLPMTMNLHQLLRGLGYPTSFALKLCFPVLLKDMWDSTNPTSRQDGWKDTLAQNPIGFRCFATQLGTSQVAEGLGGIWAEKWGSQLSYFCASGTFKALFRYLCLLLALAVQLSWLGQRAQIHIKQKCFFQPSSPAWRCYFITKRL